MVSLHCTLPCELRSGDFLEPGKPADQWECSLGFSKNSEVFLVGKTTLSIKSCEHYLLGLTATLSLSPKKLSTPLSSKTALSSSQTVFEKCCCTFISRLKSVGSTYFTWPSTELVTDTLAHLVLFCCTSISLRLIPAQK